MFAFIWLEPDAVVVGENGYWMFLRNVVDDIVFRHSWSDNIFDNFVACIYLDAYARDKPALQIVATTHNYN